MASSDPFGQGVGMFINNISYTPMCIWMRLGNEIGCMREGVRW